MKTQIWKNKKVLLTGHTGFKGAWLSLWLSQLGAQVHGVALDPPTDLNLYTLAKISSLLASDIRLDIRHEQEVRQLLCEIQPEIVFHLAAQPLVRYSYDYPLETYAVNVMGTAHVLEAIRACGSVAAAVIVTTDKCYENLERIEPYSEVDRLGGFDPYSNSKACAELVTAAYRSSFFSGKGAPRLASARAGNVIGGGDWAKNRLIPDCIRAYTANNSVHLRFPESVRPWQYVLESLSGYLLLAEKLLSDEGERFAQAWNFGPELHDMQSVGEVANQVCGILKVPLVFSQQKQEKHEAGLLRLDSAKAKQYLGWTPRWNLRTAIEETVKWYQSWLEGKVVRDFSWDQIERYGHG